EEHCAERRAERRHRIDCVGEDSILLLHGLSGVEYQPGPAPRDDVLRDLVESETGSGADILPSAIFRYQALVQEKAVHRHGYHPGPPPLSHMRRWDPATAA